MKNKNHCCNNLYLKYLVIEKNKYHASLQYLKQYLKYMLMIVNKLIKKYYEFKSIL